jgi:hypothetical protein
VRGGPGGRREDLGFTVGRLKGEHKGE